MNQLRRFVLACAVLLAGAISQVGGIVDSNIDVSPTTVSGRRSFGVRSSSYLPSGAVLGVSDACQLNFSYVSDQPVSVWFSLEGFAQTLLVLPDGRPCVNKTTCTASAFIDRNKQYVLLAEYLPEVSGSTANVVLNFSAAVPSASGCGIAGPGSVVPVIRDSSRVYDDSEPLATQFQGVECISYLATGFASLSNSYENAADVDGFVSTLANYNAWASGRFDDGRAVEIPGSACPSNVPYCAATVQNLTATESYVLVLASGYDDLQRAPALDVWLAYAAGIGGACDALDVAQSFVVELQAPA